MVALAWSDGRNGDGENGRGPRGSHGKLPMLQHLVPPNSFAGVAGVGEW